MPPPNPSGLSRASSRTNRRERAPMDRDLVFMMLLEASECLPTIHAVAGVRALLSSPRRRGSITSTVEGRALRHSFSLPLAGRGEGWGWCDRVSALKKGAVAACELFI